MHDRNLSRSRTTIRTNPVEEQETMLVGSAIIIKINNNNDNNRTYQVPQ